MIENWELDSTPICIAFSGGRSSAVMTKLMLEKFRGVRPIEVVFCNTGKEALKTYEFVERCDKEWDFNVNWIEAVPLEDGEGVDFRYVDYHTCDKEGKVFESIIEKYGIPNPGAPLCKDRLKHKPVKKFVKSLGWKNYYLAIGIRGDEIDRITSDSAKKNVFYPLVDWNWDKEMVNSFMRNQSFDLELSSDIYSNCVGCWQMSFRKLGTLALKSPESFDWWQRMEDKYKYHKSDCKAAVDPESGERRFYRGNTSVQGIFDMAHSENFKPYEDSGQLSIWDVLFYNEELDKGGSCDSGCSFV